MNLETGLKRRETARNVKYWYSWDCRRKRLSIWFALNQGGVFGSHCGQHKSRDPKVEGMGMHKF